MLTTTETLMKTVLCLWFASSLTVSVIAWLPARTSSMAMNEWQVRWRESQLMMSDSGSSGVGENVVVFGGTGFVGARVCKILSEKGATVTSISKTGQAPDWCKNEPWVSSVDWVAYDVLSGGDTSSIMSTPPDAAVSCIGVIGTDSNVLMKGNGEANVIAFDMASSDNNSLKRTGLVSVGSEVEACRENWLPEFFCSYFDGKNVAERAALDAVNGDTTRCCIVKPTFIYGGDSFGLLPPRVTQEYGSGIEELLSFGLFKLLADVTPGLIKVALRPPSSVDAVAACLAAAALGEASGTLDGTEAINEVAKQPKATGLTEFLEWSGEKLGELWEKASVEVPKIIESTKAKIEEAKK